MEIAEKIKIIAEHYGYEAQSRQCIEEMAELMQAINKLWRSIGHGQLTEKSFKECLENLTEECMTQVGFWDDDAQVASEVVEKFWADVQIMLWQMEYLLLSGQEVNQMIEKKLDRQLKRIEEE